MGLPVELLTQHGSLLPQSKKFEREGEGKRRSCSLFYNLISKDKLHSGCMPLVTNTNPSALGVGGDTRMWLAGEGDHWGHLGVWLPYY